MRNVLAKTYKVKDGNDSMVPAVKQHADDIVADAGRFIKQRKQQINLHH